MSWQRSLDDAPAFSTASINLYSPAQRSVHSGIGKRPGVNGCFRRAKAKARHGIAQCTGPVMVFRREKTIPRLPPILSRQGNLSGPTASSLRGLSSPPFFLCIQRRSPATASSSPRACSLSPERLRDLPRTMPCVRKWPMRAASMAMRRGWRKCRARRSILPRIRAT